MAKCYLCEQPLTDANSSEEHILLNVLSARLTSSELICRPCNLDAEKADDAFEVNQLAQYTFILDVKRDDGRDYPNLTSHLVITRFRSA
jgi:hypothetical protein